MVTKRGRAERIYSEHGLQYLVKNVVRYIGELSIGRIIWRHRFKRMSDADPYKVIYVNPDDINKLSATGLWWKRSSRHLQGLKRPIYYRYSDFGQVLDGDWDQSELEFDQLYEFRSLKNHFENGVPWEQTDLYRHHLDRLEAGFRSYSCGSKSELNKRFQYLDDLYKNIESEGYQLNRSIEKSGYNTSNVAQKIDEIQIDIGRNGDILYHDQGKHRLSIAKILDIDEIPVLVKIRHRDWQAIRDQAANYRDREITESIKNHMGHPDLQELL